MYGDIISKVSISKVELNNAETVEVRVDKLDVVLTGVNEMQTI